MHNIRLALALTAFLIAAPAMAAPLTITGTVGEIGIIIVGSLPYIRFKFTNVNTTAACADTQVIVNGAYAPLGVPGYAWFNGQPNNPAAQLPDPAHREWYAALLYSKKGAPITCIVSNDNSGCHVTSCTLP